MTQHEQILSHLESGGTLTVAEALTKFGIYALSQRIGEINRDPSFRSTGRYIASISESQGNKRYSRYRLELRQMDLGLSGKV